VVKVEGPAETAGMHLLDVVVEIDGEPIADTHDLACRIAARSPGKSVRLTLVRQQQRVTVTATLGHWPDRDKAGTPPPGCSGEAISSVGRPGALLSPTHGHRASWKISP
jgi:predicted metalloprotease with PDZ domain